VIRHIFNLDLGQEVLDQNISTALSLAKNVRRSAIRVKDVLIVGLDVEGAGHGHLPADGQFQIGICILDTRLLRQTKTEQDLLQSYILCVGSPEYCAKASRKFCFGKLTNVSHDELDTKIQERISRRNVILVVHGGKYDLRFLKAANLDLHPLYVLDTEGRSIST